jgi:adenylylsulfate kinase-like enzyme
MVIWIIGLSGAGKTTLAKEIVAQVSEFKQNVILLDGDIIREVFGNDLGHTIEDRRLNADRISRFCRFLDDQGIHVVCAILSIFRESRLWNRQNIKNYYEVFIDTPMEYLIDRDSKGIYKKFQEGKIKNVVGMDIHFPRPDSADLIIQNSSSIKDLLQHAKFLSTIIKNARP